MAEKSRLGRSPLGSLLSNVPPVERDGVLRQIPIDLLQPGKYQPRQDMAPEALQELANSIAAQGILQPIMIRPIGQNQYEIIAGERRWRAAQLARLSEVPAIIREVPDEAAVAMALIENIQREDLNPIEEAIALDRLSQEFQLTHQQAAEAVGKSRTTVTNLLRLLQLQGEVRQMLSKGLLDMGHARALLTLPEGDQLQVARVVVTKGLSVREAEHIVRKIQTGEKTKESASKKLDPNISQLQQNLSDQLGAVVKIQHAQTGKGKVMIHYNNLDELDGLLAHLLSTEETA